MVRLWAHECMRTFSDRFTSLDDFARFRGIVDEKMAAMLDTNWRTVMESVRGVPIGVAFVTGAAVAAVVLGLVGQCARTVCVLVASIVSMMDVTPLASPH